MAFPGRDYAPFSRHDRAAHVRNDAHPYNIYLTGFRLDPYEYFVVVNSPGKGGVITDVITAAARNPLRQDLADGIRRNKDINQLFHLVATLPTQTIFPPTRLRAFDPNPLIAKRITNANGMAEYPHPVWMAPLWTHSGITT